MLSRRRRKFGPRRLDFYIRWSMGNWAEEMTFKFGKDVLDPLFKLRVYRYGYSAGRIPGSLSEFEEILEEREKLEYGKRPNFLVFERGFADRNKSALSQLMRRPENKVEYLVKGALVAIEVEQSMWSAKRARQAGKSLSFTVKEEDLPGLYEWMDKYSKEIIIFQIFLDELHGTFLSEVIEKGRKRKDPTTKKETYFLQVSEETRLADIKDMNIEAKAWFTEKGKLVPFVAFKGGSFDNINEEALEKLIKRIKA